MASENITIITSENFNEIVSNSTVPVLIDFWADWCAPCKMIAPAIEEIAQELTTTAIVGKLNIDDQETLAMQNGVMSIPTIIIWNNGKEVERIIGARPKADFLAAIQKYM